MGAAATDVSVETASQPDPCGEALDYDLEFLELEVLAKYRPGQELGGSTIPAEPPDWREVKRLTDQLTQRSKDLRLCVLAARAALQFEGFAGLSREIAALASIAEVYWPTVHPRPDFDDEGEQLTRLNALAELCDPDGLLGEVRRQSLAESRGQGSVTLVGWTDAQRPDAQSAERAGFESAFREMPAETCDALVEQIGSSLDCLERIDKAVNEHVGGGIGTRFQPLHDALKAILKLVGGARPVQPSVKADNFEHGFDETRAVKRTGIGHRSDIVVMLDEICRWYYHNEPASPVPAILERAKRLVAKDFMALLQELAPAGIAQFQSLVGAQDKPQ